MNVKVLGIFLLLVVLCLVLGFMVPDAFLSGNNIENLLRRTAMYGILGVGVAFVIISSGIDLSIGSIVVFSACLLAIFLSVVYEPFDVGNVAEVKGADKRIVLESPIGDRFKPGDRIRYYGGRRARNAIVTVAAVEGSTLTVDAALSGNDTYGKVARVYPVKGHTDNTVTLAGAFDAIAPRDQLTLVHPESGLKQLVVTESSVAAGATTITLNDALGSSFNTEWVAVPVERKQRMPALVAVAAVLGVGIVLGLIHGLLITKVGLQPFVVTLCGLLFYRGIARWMTNDQTMGFGNEYEDGLSVIATGKLSFSSDPSAFGIPYPFFVLVGVAIIAAVVLNKTVWGRYLLALGRNEEAARYSGINTTRITIGAYVVCTALAAVGGMLFALKSNSVSPSSFGNFFELYAIAAAVLGGCSLRGGEGSILGVVIGTAVMQTLYNLIVLLKISDTLEFAIIGGVILAGVIADEMLRRYAAKRRAMQ